MASDLAEWLDFRTFRFVRDEHHQLTSLPSRDGEQTFLVFDSQRLRYARLHVFEAFAGDTEKTWWLRREMDAVARLHLPSFTGVIDSGEDEEGLYFVDELPEGEPIGGWLARVGALSSAMAVDLARQLIGRLESSTPRTRAVEHFVSDLLWVRPVGTEGVELLFADYSGWMNPSLEDEAPLVKRVAEFLLKAVGGRGRDPQITLLCEAAISGDTPMVASLAGFDQALAELVYDEAPVVTEAQLPQHFLLHWLLEGTSSTDRGEVPYSLGTSYETGGQVLVLPGLASVPMALLHPQHHYGLDGEKITDGPRCRLLSEPETLNSLETLRERISRTGPQSIEVASSLVNAVIQAADLAEPTVPIVSVKPDDILYPTIEETNTPTHFRLYPTTPSLIAGLSVPDAISEALIENRSALPRARRSALALSLFWFASTGKDRFPWDPAVPLRDERFSPETRRLMEATRTRLSEFPSSDDGTLIEQLRDIAALAHTSESPVDDDAVPTPTLVTSPEAKRKPGFFGFTPNWGTAAACIVFSLSLATIAAIMFRGNTASTPQIPIESETGARLDDPAPVLKAVDSDRSVSESRDTASNTPTTVFPETALIEIAIQDRRLNLPASVSLPFASAPAPGSTIDTTLPDGPKTAFLQEADTAREAGAYGRSVNICLEVLAENPGRTEARILLTRTIANWLSSGKAVETEDEAALLREASEIIPGAATLLVEYASAETEEASEHWLARSATSGNVEHMRDLGLRLEESNPAAIEWLTKASEGGDLEATFHLADRMIDGRGCEADPETALTLLITASQQGHASATNLLGLCYQNGWGTEPDDGEAFAQFLQGAVMSDLAAQFNLATCYAEGRGVEADLKRAAELFSLGAEQGHSDSMLAWSHCLDSGRGVEPNRADALAWYRETAATGNLAARAWCRDNGVSLGLQIP